MDSNKYYEKLETMVNEGIKNGIYKETTNTILHDLKLFQDFLYRNFKDYKDYEKMRPVYNRPARLLPKPINLIIQMTSTWIN